jgi:hypothetical protein
MLNDPFEHWRYGPWISGVGYLAGDAFGERFQSVLIAIDRHDRQALAG